jgi:hypothetical protein
VELPPVVLLTFQIRVSLGMVEVAVKLACPSGWTLAELGMRTICKSGVTVAVAFPLTKESSTDDAVIVTVAGLGMTAGAVYSPAMEIVPTVEVPPGVPFTSQVTAELSLTVAVYCCVLVAITLAEPGETIIVGADFNVTVAVSEDPE